MWGASLKNVCIGNVLLSGRVCLSSMAWKYALEVFWYSPQWNVSEDNRLYYIKNTPIHQLFNLSGIAPPLIRKCHLMMRNISRRPISDICSTVRFHRTGELIRHSDIWTRISLSKCHLRNTKNASGASKLGMFSTAETIAKPCHPEAPWNSAHGKC